MASLKLTKMPMYRVGVSTDSDEVFKALEYYLKTLVHSTIRLPKRGGGFWLKETTTRTALYLSQEKLYRLIVVNRGLIDHIAKFVISRPDLNLQFEFDKSLVSPPGIKLIDKWHTIFSNHPKGEERGMMQIDDFHKLVQRPSGLASLYTGYGKTELLLAIVESILESHPDGNIIILAGSNSVKREIELRSAKYGNEIDSPGWEGRVKVINPAGYFASNASKEQVAKDWMEKVIAAVPDECHHLSAKTWSEILEVARNVELCYAFSASADKTEGRILNSDIPLEDLGLEAAKVLSLTGPARVHRDLPVPIELYTVRRKILSDLDKERLKNSHVSAKLDASIMSVAMASTIKEIVDADHDPTNIYYIPVNTTKSGEALCQNLNNLGVKTAYWASGKLIIGSEVIDTKDPLSYLKEAGKASIFRCLITTSVGVEGIDIANLGGVIPLYGTSFRMIIQPIGRSARGDLCKIFLIYDQNNATICRQQNERKQTIQAVLNIIKTGNFGK